MGNEEKTQEQLVNQVAELRQRITKLEAVVSHHECPEKSPSPILSRRVWERIFRAIGHAILILDPRYGIISANRAAQEATGCSEEEMRHRKCYEIFHGTGKPPDAYPLEKMLISGRWETVDMSYLRLQMLRRPSISLSVRGGDLM